MTSNLKSLVAKVKNLTENEKQILINELLNRTFSYTELKETQINNKGLTCPHCTSDNIIRHGKNKGASRFLCKGCKKRPHPAL